MIVPAFAGRGAGGGRRRDHAPPGRDVRARSAVCERRLVRGAAQALAGVLPRRLRESTRRA